MNRVRGRAKGRAGPDAEWGVGPDADLGAGQARTWAQAGCGPGEGWVRGPVPAENHSTPACPSAMISLMFRYAFVLAASAVADAPKAAVPIFATAADGARS